MKKYVFQFNCIDLMKSYKNGTKGCGTSSVCICRASAILILSPDGAAAQF